MSLQLFDDAESLAPGAALLPGFALRREAVLLEALQRVLAAVRLRQMVTPGGFRMSVAMASCGELGWVSDRRGYRYSPVDPDTGLPWPEMPGAFRQLSREAAAAAGFDDFEPDACLVNRYAPGAKMSLHQDRDERDLGQPIVSVSLGLSAVFLFGGMSRSERPRRLSLAHGDVLVWGGESRLRFHGVMPLAEGLHPLLGAQRINLTFRRAG